MQKTSRMRGLLRPAVFFCLPPMLGFSISCGKAYKVEKFKDYKLHVAQSPVPMEQEFKQLVEDFNDLAKMRVLTYVSDPSEANSVIIMTPGLEAKTRGQDQRGKVGLGQWLAESHTQESLLTFNGQSGKQKIYYSMRLEFDLEYFTTRSDKTESNLYDKQKLFFHEVGHGLEMNHNTRTTSDLMYPDIYGNKDFNSFFQSVRKYMADE